MLSTGVPHREPRIEGNKRLCQSPPQQRPTSVATTPGALHSSPCRPRHLLSHPPFLRFLAALLPPPVPSAVPIHSFHHPLCFSGLNKLSDLNSIHSLTVQEVQSPKLRCWLSHAPSKMCRGILPYFLPSCRWPQGLLGCGCFPPISTSPCTWPPLCLLFL